jgi:hypothetical protein
MKRFLTTAALLVAFYSAIFAQKVDFDTKKVKVSFIVLPQKPLDKTYKFYSSNVAVQPDQLRRLGMSEANIDTRFLTVAGYKKLKEGGNFHVEMIIDEFQITKEEQKKSETTTKDKAGKETTTYKYWHEGTFTQPLEVKLTDQTGQVILSKVLRTAQTPGTFKTEENGNYKNEVESWNSNRQSFIAKANRAFLETAFADVNNFINATYGYRPSRDYLTSLEYLDSEKNPEFKAFNQAFEEAKKAIECTKPESSLDSARILAQSALAYWKKTAAATNATEKAGKKLKWACLRNLAITHFWLEEFPASIEANNTIVALDYEEKQAKNFLKEISDVQDNMTNCQVKSRHFKQEFPEEAIPANVVFETEKDEKIQAQKDRQAGMSADKATIQGKLFYVDGKTRDGNFLINVGPGGELDFLPNGNVKFVYETATDAITVPIDVNKVEKFSMGDREFILIPYKPAAAVSLGKKQNQLLEVLYKGPKMEVYKFYPTREANTGNTVIEMILNKKSENDMQSLSGMKFILKKKGTKGYFKDCPAMEAYIEAADFDALETALVKTCRFYEENCGK